MRASGGRVTPELASVIAREVEAGATWSQAMRQFSVSRSTLAAILGGYRSVDYLAQVISYEVVASASPSRPSLTKKSVRITLDCGHTLKRRLRPKPPAGLYRCPECTRSKGPSR